MHAVQHVRRMRLVAQARLTPITMSCDRQELVMTVAVACAYVEGIINRVCVGVLP
jgi:hypothetical protein